MPAHTLSFSELFPKLGPQPLLLCNLPPTQLLWPRNLEGWCSGRGLSGNWSYWELLVVNGSLFSESQITRELC